VVTNLSYARIVDAKFKPGTKEEAIGIVNRTGPGVENPAGYEGMLILTPTDDSDRVLFISLWDTEKTMMDSEKGVVVKVMDATKDLLEGKPEFKHYNVHDLLVQKKSIPA